MADLTQDRSSSQIGDAVRLRRVRVRLAIAGFCFLAPVLLAVLLIVTKPFSITETTAPITPQVESEIESSEAVETAPLPSKQSAEGDHPVGRDTIIGSDEPSQTLDSNQSAQGTGEADVPVEAITTASAEEPLAPGRFDDAFNRHVWWIELRGQQAGRHRAWLYRQLEVHQRNRPPKLRSADAPSGTNPGTTEPAATFPATPPRATEPTAPSGPRETRPPSVPAMAPQSTSPPTTSPSIRSAPATRPPSTSAPSTIAQSAPPQSTAAASTSMGGSASTGSTSSSIDRDDPSSNEFACSNYHAHCGTDDQHDNDTTSTTSTTTTNPPTTSTTNDQPTNDKHDQHDQHDNDQPTNDQPHQRPAHQRPARPARRQARPRRSLPPGPPRPRQAQQQQSLRQMGMGTATATGMATGMATAPGTGRVTESGTRTAPAADLVQAFRHSRWFGPSRGG